MNRQAYKKAWEQRIEARAKLVLLFLVYEADGNPSCSPGISKIHACTRLDHKAAMRSLKKLEQAGLITGRRAPNQPTTYTLNLDTEAGS